MNDAETVRGVERLGDRTPYRNAVAAGRGPVIGLPSTYSMTR
jgi:hypothetical protein